MTEKGNAMAQDALLEVLMQSNNATAIYQGEELRIMFANDAMLGFWGKSKKIIGQRLQEALPELSGQPFEAILKEVWRSGKSYTAQDNPAQLPDTNGNKTFYFDFNCTALLGADGHTQWILHTATEVTDRRHAWELVKEKEILEKAATTALLSSRYRVEQLVLSSPVGMTILKGTDLEIEIPNEHILHIWARTREQVLGKKLMEVFPELVDQPFPAMLASVLATGVPVYSKEIPVTISDVDGSIRDIYVDFGYQPLFNTDGVVDSVMVTVKDITEVVHVRKRLEESEQLLQEANEALAATNEEYLATNEELATLNEEFAATNEELTATNEEVNRLSEELNEANITLKQHNQELSRATKKLFALFEDAPVAIGVLEGRQLIIDSANPQLLNLWGKDSSVIGKTLENALPELRDQPFLGLLDQVYTSGEPYFGTAQKAMLMHDGQAVELYFNFTYKPIKDDEGRTHAIMIVANEVTNQVKTSQSIAAAYQQLNDALEVGNLGSYEIDLATTAINYNRNFGRDFGLDNEAINLNDLLDLVLPEYRSRLKQDMRRAIDRDSLLQGEFQIRWADGSRHWIKASGKASYNEAGQAVKLVGMTENITEQKAFDQRKDDFLSIASHELKTPVTTLRANLQLLERFKSQLGHPMAEKMVETSLRNMDKLNMMIDNLLNINRFNEGQMKIEKAPFSIKTLLNECCGTIRLERKHELIVSGDDLMVNADESRIEQVLTNLVNNAAKYAPQAKDIHLGITKLADKVKISVRDEGPGIPSDQIPHLFERYWRADHSGKNYSGLGLGLFICADIIKRHGGEIGVESALGKGTTFWFTLPL